MPLLATAVFALAKLLLTRLQDLMPLAAYLRVQRREAGAQQGAQPGEGEGPAQPAAA